MTIDRTADLFHDLLIKPEIERQRVSFPSALPGIRRIPDSMSAQGLSQLPYQRDSATSRAAAVLAIPKAGTQRRRVYDFLVGCGPRGATDDEMQARMGMNPSTQRPRRIELANAGLIEPAGEMDERVIVDPITGRFKPPHFEGVKRKTASGRDAVVWVAV